MTQFETNSADDGQAPANSQSPLLMETIVQAIKDFSNLSTLMRMSGALIIVAAMSAFLLQAWQGGDDTERFYMLLAQTGLLAMGVLGLSYLLKENKGARVFFGLGILSATANVITLSALVYSIFSWDGAGQYPSYALWKAASVSEILKASGIGALVLAPVIWFGFKIFSRNSAGLLVPLYAFSHFLLLLPIRESWMLGVVVLLAISVPALMLYKAYEKDFTLRTLEGYFASATIFIPAIIMLIRSLMFYRVDVLLEMILAATAYIVLRLFSKQAAAYPGMQTVMAFASLYFAWLFSSPFIDIVPNQTLATAIFGSLLLVFGLDIASCYRACNKIILQLTSIIFAVCYITPFMKYGDLLSTILMMVGGMVLFVVAKMHQERIIAIIGGSMALSGLVYQIYQITRFIDFTNWMTLAILGAIIIVAASVIERHGAVIKLKFDAWRATK